MSLSEKFEPDQSVQEDVGDLGGQVMEHSEKALTVENDEICKRHQRVELNEKRDKEINPVGGKCEDVSDICDPQCSVDVMMDDEDLTV